MQKSGFFNALLNNGQYDRKYNANDYADNLAVVISNGVLRSANDDLKVSANGMVVTVGVGRAWINGHYYMNDTPHSFAATVAPIGGTRWDRVVLRLDNNIGVRSISLVYVQGTASNSPTKPAPVRAGNIYDLVLADIFIGTNATTLTVTDTRANTSVCGWLYSTVGNEAFFTTLDNKFNEWFEGAKNTLASVSLFKRYNWRTVLTASAKTVQFNIPQYDSETCFIEVFVNGLLVTESVDYTFTGSIITFTGTLTTGTEIEVKCYKSIDGTGIMKVAEEITALQNAVAALNTTADYEYICNGKDDNVKISQLAQAWLNGGTDYGSKTIKVYGNCGITAAHSGDGTTTSPFIWFRIGAGGTTNRRVIIDFSNCSQINITCANATVNTVFFGLQTHVIGANVIATGGDEITMFSTAGQTQAIAENCRFWITSGKAYIARGGVFRNCRGSVTTTAGDAYVFNTLSGGLLRVEGGEYYAYAPTGSMSQVIYVNSAQSNATVITYAMNCPQNTRNGFVQSYAINCLTASALCSFTDTITPLPITASGQNIRGTLVVNKPNIL